MDELVNSRNVFHLIKWLSTDTLENIGYQLWKLHQSLPAEDWYKYFGIYPSDNITIISGADQTPNLQVNHSQSPPSDAEITQLCAACDKSLSKAEEQYCNKFKKRFSGKTYCYQCQCKIKRTDK